MWNEVAIGYGLAIEADVVDMTEHAPVALDRDGNERSDLDDSVRREIEAALASDDTLIGEIWRRTRDGQSDEAIQAWRKASYPNFIWSYRRALRAFFGELPTAPSVALFTLRSLRSFIKRTSLSPETRQVLDERVAALEKTASAQEAIEIEDRQAREETARAEERGVPGIYVYSLPHYIRHPYEEDSGRTLLKVGRADRDVIRRFREQTRTTALPEDPVLLRVYACETAEANAKERTFHRLLEAADHERSKARTGGTEWFLTSLRFLDEVAAVLGLSIQDVAPLAEGAGA